MSAESEVLVQAQYLRSFQACSVQRRKKARIIATDSKGRSGPIVALVEVIEDVEFPYTFTADGKIAADFRNHPFDLLNLPNRREEYRTFIQSSTFPLSNARSLKGARAYGAEILKFSYEDDKLISVEIVK